MKQLYEMNDLVKGLLMDQQIPDGAKLRPTAFHVTAAVDEGTLLFHTMTKEFLLLDEDELKALYGEGGSAEMRDYLIRHWFLVPEDLDECALSDEVREVTRLSLFGKLNGKLNRFTILSTTDCNARCYYCYEKGCEMFHMSDETAHRTARYILDHKADGSISLEWFGGEPLYNSRAIDLICADLRQAGCEYTSSMISNGYLFSKELIAKAADIWKLKSVQITLDGTEEVYNRSKAFIYKNDPSPFRTVLGNIKALTAAGIMVNIRLNASLSNIEDLFVLCDRLEKELADRSHWNVFAHQLFQLNERLFCGDLEDFSIRLRDLHMRLSGMGDRKGKRNGLTLTVKANHCMADSPADISIMPDGRLTKCEHFENGPTVGHIESERLDEEGLAFWEKPGGRYPACKTCPIYPECVRLEHCESGNEFSCYKILEKDVLKTKRGEMLESYRRLKEKGKA